MHKKLFLGTATVALIAITGAAVFALNKDPGEDVSNISSVSSSSARANNENPVTGEPITVTGTVGCLAHKDTSGPQIEICAIGIAGDNGKNYALHSQDPSVTGSIPTGQRIQVSGTFTPQTTPYDSQGTIDVTSVQQQ